MPLTTDDVRNALKKVVDPEIHINVVDLGIIYGVDIRPDGKGKHAVTVKATLTTPACPYGPALLSQMHAEITVLPEVSDVDIDLVWNPPWNPRTMASPEAKTMMGFLDFEDMEMEEAVENTAEEKKAVP
jgi:metal-sulfur cluster biosynthetic enzyme